MKPKIAIIPGDPSGIGPELIARLITSEGVREAADILLIGDRHVLEAGMAITIEPGCYIIPMLLEPLRHDARGEHIDWKLVEALAPHGGVRIEDNLVITADGALNLTRSPATGL